MRNEAKTQHDGQDAWPCRSDLRGSDPRSANDARWPEHGENYETKPNPVLRNKPGPVGSMPESANAPAMLLRVLPTQFPGHGDAGMMRGSTSIPRVTIIIESPRRFERVFQVLSRLLVLAVASASLGLAAPGYSVDDVRTWKDASGKFTIKAKFVSVADGVVTLLDVAGEKVEIELEQLAEADKTYVAGRQKEAANPFQKKAADTPFRKKPAGSVEAAGSRTVGEGKVVQPDWSKVRTLVSTPTNLEWKVAAGASAAPSPAAKARPVPLPAKTSFFEGAKALVANGPGTRAVVGYLAGDPGKAPISRVVLCDLEAGKSVGGGAVPGSYVNLALSDAGDRSPSRSPLPPVRRRRSPTARWGRASGSTSSRSGLRSVASGLRIRGRWRGRRVRRPSRSSIWLT